MGLNDRAFLLTHPGDVMTENAVVATPACHVVVPCALGWVIADLADDRVVSLTIVEERPAAAEAVGPLATRLRDALDAYFQSGRWPVDLPIAPRGTTFQRRVWRVLRRIPPGHTRSYGDIAGELGTSARAVGNACRANPLLLLIPCHRVVAAHGRGGFGGHTEGRWPAMKEWLLVHEQSTA
jgi:methylated-DNA-[protein]-cysteine S-methyltransferase